MKFAAGWGDSLSASNSAGVEKSPHPVTHFAALMRVDPPPVGSLQGRVLPFAQKHLSKKSWFGPRWT